MLSTRMLTKKEIIELIEEHFSETRPTEKIACLISYNEGVDKPAQQTLIFNRELEGFRV